MRWRRQNATGVKLKMHGSVDYLEQTDWMLSKYDIVPLQ